MYMKTIEIYDTTAEVSFLLSDGSIINVPTGKHFNSIPEGIAIDSILYTVLSEGIESIGEYAFANSSLEEIRLPSSLKTIGKGAFHNTELKEVSLLHTAVHSLPEKCFSESFQLTSVLMNNHITELGDYCFFGCTKLKTINLKKLSVIGTGCFGYCYSLQKPSLRPNVMLGNNSFSIDSNNYLLLEGDVLSLASGNEIPVFIHGDGMLIAPKIFQYRIPMDMMDNALRGFLYSYMNHIEYDSRVLSSYCVYLNQYIVRFLKKYPDYPILKILIEQYVMDTDDRKKNEEIIKTLRLLERDEELYSFIDLLHTVKDDDNYLYEGDQSDVCSSICDEEWLDY